MAKGDSVAGLGDKVISLIVTLILIAVGLLVFFQIWVGSKVENNATDSTRPIVAIVPLIGVAVIIILLVLLIANAVKQK